MHLVMALPNVFFHDLRPMGTMLPLATKEDGTAVGLDDLDLESFGAVNYTDLTWRSLIDGYVCSNSCLLCKHSRLPYLTEINDQQCGQMVENEW